MTLRGSTHLIWVENRFWGFRHLMDFNILERGQVMLTPASLKLSCRNKLLTTNPVQVRATKGQKMLGDLKALEMTSSVSFLRFTYTWEKSLPVSLRPIL